MKYIFRIMAVAFAFLGAMDPLIASEKCGTAAADSECVRFGSTQKSAPTQAEGILKYFKKITYPYLGKSGVWPRYGANKTSANLVNPEFFLSRQSLVEIRSIGEYTGPVSYNYFPNYCVVTVEMAFLKKDPPLQGYWKLSPELFNSELGSNGMGGCSQPAGPHWDYSGQITLPAGHWALEHIGYGHDRIGQVKWTEVRIMAYPLPAE